MVNEHWREGIIESNAVSELYLAGRWDEALNRDDRGRPPSGPAFKDAELALIQMARGNLQDAVELLRGQELLAVDDQPMMKRDYAETMAQLRLLQQRPHEALALALEAAELTHDTEDELVSGGLLRIGLEAAVASHSPDGFDRLMALLRRAVSGVGARRWLRLWPVNRLGFDVAAPGRARPRTEWPVGWRYREAQAR